ncbi:MAG: hypothetical protein QXJ75_05610 [Candidatus Bathyarchaeia archaeon]
MQCTRQVIGCRRKLEKLGGRAMPRHTDFEKIYQNFLAQYGEEKGESLYYAWLKKHSLDDTKPLEPQRPKLEEAFEWASPLSWYGYHNIIRGVALVPRTSLNMNHYVEEELVKAARSLADRPIYINHVRDATPIQGQSAPVVGKILDAEYIPDRGLEYVGYISDPVVWDLVQRRVITTVSVGGRYRSADYEDGVEPHGLVFEELSLIWGDEKPSVPEAYVAVWERVCEKILKYKDVDGRETIGSENSDAAEASGRLAPNEILKDLVDSIARLKTDLAELRAKVALLESKPTPRRIVCERLHGLGLVEAPAQQLTERGLFDLKALRLRDVMPRRRR